MIHDNQTFRDVSWAMYSGHTFNHCTFQGFAKSCNFAEAAFNDCTFADGFKFETCTLGGSTGLPKHLAPEPRIERTEGGRK